MYYSDQYRLLIKRMEELFDNPHAEVVLKSGKSHPTVIKFFRQEHIRNSSWESIYDACLNLISDKEKQRQSLFDKQKKLLQTKTPNPLK